ncbi:MAG TPA: ABC-F family ATP-binding cassette domain-containing protein [Candidatus Dormibacteraeota bacterium]|nr:ABC-F family ATP-binding cassette domain-containing protein [Candidatus Dormibacteraeota bacterium]
MALLSCSEVSVEYGDRVVFAGLDLKLEPGDRIGVVGSNGEGKSSLLSLLAGTQAPSAGRLDRQGRLLVAHLPQESPDPVAETVLGEAMASRIDLARLRDELGHLEQLLTIPGPESEAQLARYGEAQSAYDGLGGYELEARARAVLSGLGLGDGEQSRSPRELSVGQVRRLELSKLLLQDVDLLLLDEPTNHLDLVAIEWLEAHLLQSAPTLCLVAHDRRLLERVCNRIVELQSGRAEVYEGGYTSYLRQRQERRLRWRRTWEAQQAHISHQEEYIRRYKAGQRARQARGRQTLLDRLERVPEPTELQRMRLTLHAAPSAQVVLRTESLACGRDQVALFSVPDMGVARGARIAVLGPNGSGKTTLLHTLAGQLPPVRGRVIPGARARIREYHQDFADLDSERTVLENLLDDHPGSLPERARAVLGAMLFSGERALSRVRDLSGGEKARVALSRLGMDDANCLLLDEPTNHLDIPSQEVLEEALAEYPGAVVLVSHDRYFVDSVAQTVFDVEDGRLIERRSAPPPPTRATQPSKPRGQTRNPRARNSGPAPAGPAGRQLELRIQTLEEEKRRLEAMLADPDTYRTPDQGRAALSRFETVQGALESAYATWLSREPSTER